MRATYVQPGHVIEVTAPSGGVTVGGVYVINELLMVAMTTAAEGDAFAGRINGVFYAEKVAAEAWAEGDAIYFDADANLFTSVAEDTTFAGIAARAAVAGRSLGYVLLNGIAEPSAGGAVSESSLVHQSSVTLTDDQIKALPTTDREDLVNRHVVAPAAGAGTFIQLVSGHILLDASHGGYTGFDALNEFFHFAVAFWRQSLYYESLAGAFSDGSGIHLIAFPAADFISAVPPDHGSGISATWVGDRGDVENEALIFGRGRSSGGTALLGGDPANSAVITAVFYVYSFTLNRFLAVAESGWNETTQLFE